MKLRSWSVILAVVLAVSGEKASADFIVVTGNSNIYGGGLVTPPAPLGGGAGEFAVDFRSWWQLPDIFSFRFGHLQRWGQLLGRRWSCG